MRQRGRFAGFSLYVSNSTDRQSKDLCYKDGPELPPLDFNINCTKFGRYVIFYNERLNGINYPVGYVLSNVVTELCEVTVTGIHVFFISVRIIKTQINPFHFLIIINILIFIPEKIVPLLVSMEVTVIYPVQRIVKNVDVTSSMEPVLGVHWDGWGSIVQ